jgi:transcriptional regulator with XRE-family HTH domain
VDTLAAETPNMQSRYGRSSNPVRQSLRERRRKLGVSQEAFADLCELDRTYVGGIERGERNVALVNIEKLARALKISLSELFRGV